MEIHVACVFVCARACACARLCVWLFLRMCACADYGLQNNLEDLRLFE